MGRTVPLAVRFERFTDRSADTDCWLWRGGCDPGGYGIVWVDGTSRRAHRVAWELMNGPIPAGMFVCHSCDTPSCVRESHLFLGSALVNNRDKVAKGRHPNSVKTECPEGHEYAGDNLYLDRAGARHCKTCMRDRVQRRREAAL